MLKCLDFQMFALGPHQLRERGLRRTVAGYVGRWRRRAPRVPAAPSPPFVPRCTEQCERARAVGESRCDRGLPIGRLPPGETARNRRHLARARLQPDHPPASLPRYRHRPRRRCRRGPSRRASGSPYQRTWQQSQARVGGSTGEQQGPRFLATHRRLVAHCLPGVERTHHEGTRIVAATFSVVREGLVCRGDPCGGGTARRPTPKMRRSG